MNVAPVLVLLAGGKSTRMDSYPKGLLNFGRNYWILEQISRYSSFDNPKVIIGLGHDNELYFEAILWLSDALDDYYLYKGVEVKVVINSQPELGAFSTLKTVLNIVDKDAIILVQPIDVPIADRQSLVAIINEQNDIVIPKCENKNGHPVKLLPKFWLTLLVVDTSLEKARLDMQIKNSKQSSITYINVLDKSVYQNINTLNDWNHYLKQISIKF